MGRSNRALAIASGAAAALLACSSANSDFVHWVVGGGTWNQARNWSSGVVPTALDIVYVGDTAAAGGGLVTLTGPAPTMSVLISNGMSLSTSGWPLTAQFHVDVDGQVRSGGTRQLTSLVIDNGPAAVDVSTQTATVQHGAILEIKDGATLEAMSTITVASGSELRGWGTILYPSPPLYMIVNDGTLRPGVGGLTITPPQNLWGGGIDLDGSTVGDGTLVSLTEASADGTQFAFLEVRCGFMRDFGDTMEIAAGNRLSILEGNDDNLWTMTPTSLLRIIGRDQSPGAALITMSGVKCRGLIEFVGPPAVARVEKCLLDGCHIVMRPGDRAELFGTHKIINSTVSGGELDLIGTSNWAGSLTSDALVRQFGNPVMTAPSVLTGVTVDLDGDEATVWNIKNFMTWNVQHIDTLPEQVFNGTIDFAATTAGFLTVNILQSDPAWVMGGTIKLSGTGTSYLQRIAGSPMIVTGNVVVAGKTRILADTLLAAGATVTFQDGSSTVRFDGVTSVFAGTLFQGAGKFEVSSAGQLTVESGTGMAQLDLVAEGALAVDTGIGHLALKSITMAPSTAWNVQLSGSDSDAGLDRITVGGIATVNGVVHVSMLTPPTGTFDPQVGDSFTVLTAAQGVVGSFINETIDPPVAYANQKRYQWQIVRTPSEVRLVVAQVTACAADLVPDGIVDGGDLGALLSSWGPCRECAADLNGDGNVDGADLGTLLGSWGACSN